MIADYVSQKTIKVCFTRCVLRLTQLTKQRLYAFVFTRAKRLAEPVQPDFIEADQHKYDSYRPLGPDIQSLHVSDDGAHIRHTCRNNA